jgi:hypothetical protein
MNAENMSGCPGAGISCSRAEVRHMAGQKTYSRAPVSSACLLPFFASLLLWFVVYQDDPAQFVQNDMI